MIRLETISFRYAKGAPAVLKDISLTIPDGEIFGLLGPSGAGKSTLQKVLIRLLDGYQGQAEVMGRDLSHWGTDYYERVGVSFELPNHYLKLTAFENLRFYAALYARPTADPMTLLERVGLGEDAHKPVGQFSKGMRMRLNLARALLHGPDLLFLDEPTSGLDPAMGRAMRGIIREERARGATVFLTTHDMAVADDLCDRVGFIVDGEIRAVDTPDRLKQAYGRRSVRVTWTGESGSEAREFPLDGLADNGEFQTILRDERIETLHSQEPTLETIFILVTGRRLT